MDTLKWMNKDQIAWAQAVVREHHYLKTSVDNRTSVQGYLIQAEEICHKPSFDIEVVKLVRTGNLVQLGLFLFGRPEATRCADWYGSVEDMQAGRCEVTRWQVLNLSRVWFAPYVQPGGVYHSPLYLPGFTDRKGNFRSTLVSTYLNHALDRVVLDYLLARPPCFLDEPYQLEYCLSYCDTRLHKGTVYRAAGFELYRTNKEGIQTWRKRLRPLTTEEDRQIKQASQFSERSQAYRANRQYAGAQLAMF